MSNAAAPSPDLAVLTEGTKYSRTIKDKNGKEHAILPLNMADVCEFERFIGTTLVGLDLRELRVEQAVFALWLSLRKTGKTDDQVERKDFAMTMPALQRLLPATMWLTAPKVFVDILVASGFPDPTQKDDEKDPQEASQAKAGDAAPIL